MKKFEKEIKNIAKKFKIEYVILFGSYAMGYAWRESDIDIAVKIRNLPKDFEKKLRLKIEIEKEFEKIFKKEVDITFINELNPGSKFEILRDGKVIFVKNRNNFVEEKAKIIAEYHDYKEFLKEFEEKIKK